MSILLWVCLFYWLRLYKSFAKYIYLITATLGDIVSFMFLFILILLSFTSGLYMLDYHSEKYEFPWENHTATIPNMQPVLASGGKVVDDPFENGYWNAFINQYLLGLGEFSIDSFKDNQY